MSEATVVITEDLGRRSDKGPWAAKDGNGELWKRWDQSWDPFIGKRLKLTYEIKSREWQGRTFQDNIVSAHELVQESENGDEPKLGTGDYITGQKPAIEVRRIFASTAWNCAARMAQSDLGYDAAKHIADKIFMDLLHKGQALEDGDIPF